MTNGSGWVNQFLAAPRPVIQVTGSGGPMLPTPGGYGPTPNMPFMSAPHPTTRAAGYGPITLGTEGYDRAFVTAHQRRAGRNETGDTGRQGQSGRVRRTGVQGFDATTLRVK